MDQYGVIGYPVAHSRSPLIHGLFAKQTRQDMVYRLHEVAPEDFATSVTAFFTGGGRGLNVTLPHKPAAAAFANELTPRARLAGAVNTLAAQPDGAIVGDNTDGAGLVRDLTENLRVELTGKRVLVIGAGGAARGVLGPLLEFAPDRLQVINRTADRAVALAQRFRHLGPIEGSGFDGLGPEAYDVVINATSSATVSGTRPDVSTSIIASRTVCYDMAYGREPTPFLRWAAAEGTAGTHLGWGMLVEQAAESFQLWRGIRPDTRPVLELLIKSA